MAVAAAAIVCTTFFANGGANSATVTMDFNDYNVTTGVIDTSYTQNGITMTTLTGHFDIYGEIVGGTPSDNVAAIHNGNDGEAVEFVYSGGNFDLLSVDITGYLIRDELGFSTLPVTFTSSSGATHTVTGPTDVGLVDFSSLSGWSNIAFFTMGVPLGVDTCSLCDIAGFDDVTLRDPVSPVPVPAALPLFVSALTGFGWLGWKRNRARA